MWQCGEKVLPLALFQKLIASVSHSAAKCFVTQAADMFTSLHPGDIAWAGHGILMLLLSIIRMHVIRGLVF
jgi:hypothetical protein